MEQFIMNNCKIANELRKYRDLTGCINRVALSGDPGNYAEYIITRELSYLDLKSENNVCVLGGGLKEKLFDYTDPVGETGGQVTLWPHRHGTDGFYICRMARQP